MSANLLSAVDLNNPITWAIVIGWIMSVVLHEFSHGFVAYLGGDYTIKERGGLTLNPLQYIDPLTSLVLPVVFMLMGGMPLVGGVTYVRRDLLRSRKWDFAVSAAGPAMNLILFVLFSLPFHPGLRWIDPSVPVEDYRPWQIFCAGMAQVQMIAVIMNLLPLPPLDGFQMLAAGMDEVQRQKFLTPPIPMIGMIVYFAIFSNRAPFDVIYRLTHQLQEWMGFDWRGIEMMRKGYNLALFGHTD